MAGKKAWFQKEFYKGGLKVSEVLNAVPDSCQSHGDDLVHAAPGLDQTESTFLKIMHLLDS